MTQYPILFSRRDQIETSDYTAGVTVAGRILVTDHDGEFWAEGINPGGMAAKGSSPGEALKALCVTYHDILLDIADEEPTFDGFKKAAERFFDDTNIVALEEWDKAVVEVRAGNLTLAEMAKRPSDAPIGMSVRLLEKTTTSGQEVSDAAIAA